MFVCVCDNPCLKPTSSTTAWASFLVYLHVQCSQHLADTSVRQMMKQQHSSLRSFMVDQQTEGNWWFFNTVKLHYNGLLGTIQKRPLYPKSAVSRLDHIWTAHKIHGHDIHATFLAIFDERYNYMKANVKWHRVFSDNIFTMWLSARPVSVA